MSSTRTLVFGVTQAVYPKKGKRPAATVAQVAVWNEYGTETIPPRPAFRSGMEYALSVNKKLIGAQLKNITQRILSKRTGDIDKSLKVLLTQIGKSAKAKTVEIIKTGSEPPPNAPSTIARKGFNHPWYESGLLLEHVDYEVSE